MRINATAGLTLSFLALASCSAPAEESFLPSDFRAFGLNPFWDVEVTDGELIYSNPGDFIGAGGAGGGSVPYERVNSPERVEISATIDNFPLRLIITPDQCRSSGTDSVYPWSVERTYGMDSAPGCATPF